MADLCMSTNERQGFMQFALVWQMHLDRVTRYTPVSPSANWWPLFGWILFLHTKRMSKVQKGHQVGAILGGWLTSHTKALGLPVHPRAFRGAKPPSIHSSYSLS
jgi:hypothetical protein